MHTNILLTLDHIIAQSRKLMARHGAKMKRTLTITLNGAEVTAEVPEHALLLDVLRETFGVNGPKYGCGKAQCGACTVLVDGVPARACVLVASRVSGARITTLEGLVDPETGALSPVQQGFLDCEGAQCGYCLSGMVMTATALLKRRPDPNTEDIVQALRHNLCRCGTHKEIIASVKRAAELMRKHANA